MEWCSSIGASIIQRMLHAYQSIVYRFVEPPSVVSEIIPITDPVYIAKWKDMQHRPTITSFRKGSHAATITYNDGHQHDHIMVALAQYGWGKAAMIQDTLHPTLYRLDFMVDPIEFCRHKDRSVPFCIHFKFIINDEWTLNREYWRVVESNGAIVNNFHCLSPNDESDLRPNHELLW